MGAAIALVPLAVEVAATTVAAAAAAAPAATAAVAFVAAPAVAGTAVVVGAASALVPAVGTAVAAAAPTVAAITTTVASLGPAAAAMTTAAVGVAEAAAATGAVAAVTAAAAAPVVAATAGPVLLGAAALGAVSVGAAGVVQAYTSMMESSPAQPMPREPQGLRAGPGAAPACFSITSSEQFRVISATSFQVQGSTVTNQMIPYNFKFVVLNYGRSGHPELHAGIVVNGAFLLSGSAHRFNCILLERWSNGIGMKICPSESMAVEEFQHGFSVQRFKTTRAFSSSATAGKLVEAALRDLSRHFPNSGEFGGLIQQEMVSAGISKEQAKKQVVWKQTINPQAQLTNCTLFATRAGLELGGGEVFFNQAGEAVAAVHF